MAIKIQYNKTFIQYLERQLRIRRNALPTLKNKETALRMEVKKLGDYYEKLEKQIQSLKDELNPFIQMWAEFPRIVSIENLDMGTKNIAGTKVPDLQEVNFLVRDISFLNQPAWIPFGVEKLKELVRKKMEASVVSRAFHLLVYARKKTTQKVNLYEKVQIPQYEQAISKINRYLEDQENLSKAAQKIVKARHEQQKMQ